MIHRREAVSEGFGERGQEYDFAFEDCERGHHCPRIEMPVDKVPGKDGFPPEG